MYTPLKSTSFTVYGCSRGDIQTLANDTRKKSKYLLSNAIVMMAVMVHENSLSDIRNTDSDIYMDENVRNLIYASKSLLADTQYVKKPNRSQHYLEYLVRPDECIDSIASV